MSAPAKGDAESRFDYANLTDIRRIAIAADIRFVAAELGDQWCAVAACFQPGHLSPLFAHQTADDPSTRVSRVELEKLVMTVTLGSAMQLA